jgi:hypothetical protein
MRHRAIKRSGFNPIPTDYFAYYPFNGNANDESGNGYNGTVTGAVLTTDRKGAANKAYLFDGGDYIQTPLFSELDLAQDYTINFWFLHDASVSNKAFSYAPTGQRLNIFAGSNVFVGHFDGTTYNPKSSSSLTDNIWYMVTMLHNGTTKENRLFVNNVEQSGTTAPGNAIVVNTCYIGRVGSSYYGGKLDDFRMYARQITELEITYLFNE